MNGKDMIIDLRERPVYKAPRIEDFGEIADVTRARTEGSPWRQVPEALLQRPASVKA